MAVVVITNAPEAYDYGMTVLSSEPIPGFQKNGLNHRYPLRRVMLDDRENNYFANYQCDRYRSGLYLVLNETQYASWITDGLIVLSEEDPRP